MSGGKGGSTTQSIPAWVEDAGKKNLARADEIAKIGYVPYSGPDVAAFTPMQQSAFGNTMAASSAYGLGGGGMTGMEGMPQATEMAGGGYGYSSAPMYEQAIEQLRQKSPGQYDLMRGMFIDPVTGAQPMAPFGPGSAGGAAAAAPNENFPIREYDHSLDR